MTFPHHASVLIGKDRSPLTPMKQLRAAGKSKVRAAKSAGTIRAKALLRKMR